ncbi:hypothetical protein ACFSSC_08605 [Corynebacterium mendelii]|uniref:Uncharacterized protein n=1 Tax=Corynebacterium mendelii TaxID=2765362 RepID=A0A939IYU6_9CORY|nr:hypothetical protein [Corynebacterium mendelii]MBN9645037.1 hypothetical protein [Corynebacterium mendelii]
MQRTKAVAVAGAVVVVALACGMAIGAVVTRTWINLRDVCVVWASTGGRNPDNDSWRCRYRGIDPAMTPPAAVDAGPPLGLPVAGAVNQGSNILVLRSPDIDNDDYAAASSCTVGYVDAAAHRLWFAGHCLKQHEPQPADAPARVYVPGTDPKPLYIGDGVGFGSSGGADVAYVTVDPQMLGSNIFTGDTLGDWRDAGVPSRVEHNNLCVWSRKQQQSVCVKLADVKVTGRITGDAGPAPVAIDGAFELNGYIPAGDRRVTVGGDSGGPVWIQDPSGGRTMIGILDTGSVLETQSNRVFTGIGASGLKPFIGRQAGGPEQTFATMPFQGFSWPVRCRQLVYGAACTNELFGQSNPGK